MYFDNYLKPNQPPLGQKLDHASIAFLHQQSLGGFDTLPPNQRPYFNPRVAENTTVPSPGVNKNVEEQARQFVGYPTGSTQGNYQRQQSFQVKNNVSFNSELPNSNFNKETSEFMKRRDSIAQNTFLRSNQQYSPSHGKNLMGENGMKNNMKMGTANQQHKSVQQGQKQSGSANSISNVSGNGFYEQEYATTRGQKDAIQEKQQKDNKQGYFTSTNFSDYGFSESKLNSKPYAAGFRTGGENFEFEARRGQQGYGKDKQEKPLQEKEFMYNFQLKNITSELGKFNKQGTSTNSNTSIPTDEPKYYTPSLAKKSSDKQDSSFMSKNGFSHLVDIRHNNNMMERENQASTLTEREIYKSPSFDALLSGGIVKENFRGKWGTVMENQQQNQQQSQQQHNQSSSSNSFSSQQHNSKQPSQSLISNQPYSNKPPSQSHLPDPQQKFPKQPNPKTYHQLIENLQKKFSQQKKSSQSFETKQKNYLAQLQKKDQKIKRLQTIIQNNKETIAAMEETIKQLRRKSEEVKEDVSSKVSGGELVEELKKENFNLKEEIKRQRKKSVSMAEQAMVKELSEKQETKIKDLQRALTELGKEKENLSLQLIKLKELNSSIQENYCNQIKQHQKTKQQYQVINQKYQATNKQHQTNKEQLKKTTQQKDQLNLAYQQKLQSFNQVKAMLSNLQQKYESSLQKLLVQEEQFDKERGLWEVKRAEEIERLKAEVRRLEGEISAKGMKIKTLQEKLLQKETELHKAITSNQLSINQIVSLLKQQSKASKQNFKKKQLAYFQLSQQFSLNNQQLQKVTQQKQHLQSKLHQMQSNLLALTLTVSSYQTANKTQESPKKNTDSAEIKTLESEEGRDLGECNREMYSLLELYHERYVEVVGLFNLSEGTEVKTEQQASLSSLTTMHHQCIQSAQISTMKLHPSREYLTQHHSLLIQQIKKVLKDMKKLLNVLKQCQTQSQQKTQRLYELDKTFKKQANKINQLMGEIHLKNMTIGEISRMQVEKDIFRLNEKYEILSHVALGEV